MSYGRDKKAITESKKSKTLRITLAVLYFIQVVLTTFPFMWGVSEKGELKQLTAFEVAVQPGGYDGAQDIKLAIIFAVLVLFPAVCFFFCILNKTLVKDFLSIVCALTCAGIITFGIGGLIAMGGVVALLLYILILFLSTMSLLSSVAVQNTEE
ncbi:MAG: hypothetical protein IJD68_01535 [Ruminococcus sp.]|nr:hypothetical protein [Ruminococcus sp.]